MSSAVKTFGITVPHKSELCCAICKIVDTENDLLVYSNFCSNKLKCRQFLRETPQAMAAPITNRKILEAGGSAYVIVRREFFESCTFQDHCDALNVQVMDLMDPIPTYVYKTCFLHTVEYKLAPQWNKVGLYLVEGRDFFSSTGSVNAVTLDLREIRGDNARLQVEAINLKIPFVRLNTARPSQHDIQPPVRVLPSMKMANVLDISKRIKDKHLFKDYEHLRAYWKDMHGYVLPDYEEGVLFYDIEFIYFKSNAFLYPETCLTSGPLQVLPPPIDPVPIIYRFVGDLRGRVLNLCGQQLDIYPENTYQAAVLAYTPIPTTGRFSICDTGYGTQSRRINNTPSSFDISDMYETPVKRMRLSLSRANDFPMCEIKSDDLDLGISLPSCSMNKLQRCKSIDNIAILCDADVADSSTIQKDESKSHYFKKEEQSQNQPFKKLSETKAKRKDSNLREKLLKAKGNE